MRRHVLFAAAPACALLALSPLAARAEITTPAPPGHASGVALQVGSLLDISKTDAVADSADPSASASVIRIGGQPLAGLGGSQKGDGEQAGSLLDTGDSLPARLELAPWKAAVDGAAGPTRHSKASAALARATVANALKLSVLQSESEASYTDQRSTGTAYSDGIDLGLLDAVHLVLLHSEVKSEGRGNSYLVGLNGTEIGTDGSLGHSPLCALSVPSVLSLSCLSASGGAAGNLTSAAANVAKVDPAIDAVKVLDPLAAFTAAASSGAGAAPAITLPAAPAPIIAAGAEDTRAAAAPAIAGQEALPRTGAALAGLGVSALVALMAGAALRLIGRRRVTA
jgi:hypothetical protein